MLCDGGGGCGGVNGDVGDGDGCGGGGCGDGA